MELFRCGKRSLLIWEFEEAHQRWLPLVELGSPEDKGDAVYAVAWAPNIGRYPDDPLDRQWHPWVFNDTNTIAITTNMHMMRYVDNDMFEAPSTVMQTAVTPDTRKNMAVYWDWSFVHLMLKDPSPSYMSTLYISELQLLPRNAVRQFDIFWDDDIDQAYLAKAYSPEYLFSEPIYSIQPFHINQGDNTYTISLRATANSTLPPIINAFEAFAVISTTELETDSQDVSAIMAIKDMYKVHKNWMGDPCAPKTFVWDGLTCIYVASSPPRITKVNMSFVGLSGVISSSFANLTAVQYMDLSHNNLSGTIPDSLSQLSSLQILDLTGNHLSGPTPPGILKRIQDGTLVLKYENNPELSTNVDSRRMSQRKSKLAMYIAIPVVLVVVIVSLVAATSHILRRQNRVSNGAHVQSSLQHENLRFTYKQLQTMTENFRQVLGQGGFGTVYYGQFGSKQVAVKLRSDDSRQGPKEFLAEARILTRIHHRNLVSLIGYCKDRGHMALVYEYMPKGTLKDHISRSGRNGILFTWRQRLKIVVESAQGLEYLHKSCSPPLIHLDIKPANILLSDILEAKIADFGLSKVFNSENEVHISTGGHPAGTVGYMDPEYLETGQPTVKSDVYSFGVVMLELITGRPAIMSNGVNIITWVQQKKERGNIECLVDPCMRGEHDVNSVHKAVETALKCTTRASTQRPTMTNVVAQLQECLKLEDARASIFYSCNSNDP